MELPHIETHLSDTGGHQLYSRNKQIISRAERLNRSKKGGVYFMTYWLGKQPGGVTSILSLDLIPEMESYQKAAVRGWKEEAQRLGSHVRET